jgi:hypothetical protein
VCSRVRDMRLAIKAAVGAEVEGYMLDVEAMKAKCADHDAMHNFQANESSKLRTALATAEREREQLRVSFDSELDKWRRYKDEQQSNTSRILQLQHGAEREREEARELAVSLADWREYEDHRELTSERAPWPLREDWREYVDEWRQASARKERDDNEQR